MNVSKLAFALVFLAGCGDDPGRDVDEVGDSGSGDSSSTDSSSTGDSDSTDSSSTTGDSDSTDSSSTTEDSDSTDSSSTDSSSDESTTGDPEDCLTNPIPWCTADTKPTPNGIPDEPAGIGGCPPGMTRVDSFCIDRWEAALVEVLPNDALAGRQRTRLGPAGLHQPSPGGSRLPNGGQANVQRHRVAARVSGQHDHHLSIRQCPDAGRLQ